MMKNLQRIAATALILVLIGMAGLAGFVYSGVYNIGADDHHVRPVYAALRTLRERSIAVRSRDLEVPNLADETLVLKGAGQYAAMCTQCHLTPAMKDSEIRPGLYPQPPNLSKVRIDPREAFWAIKHGIKMSAMPAWGGSHDDATIWSMVAFLQKLPDLSPAQYQQMVARAPPDDDMDMDGDAHEPSGSAAEMPAMPASSGAAHAVAPENRQIHRGG